jgi:hypothetical protein
MADAGAFYDKVLQFPKSPVARYALYKRAWVHVNLTEFQRALELFFEVHRGTTDPSLAAACRTGVVLTYANVGRADKARAVFARVSAAHADAMFEELVDYYDRSGMSEPAFLGYRELIRGRPADPRACEWQLGAVRNAQAVRKPAELLGEALALLKVAGQVKTAACDAIAGSQAIELADAWHAEAQKTLAVETFTRASGLYAAYLAAFPAAPAAAEVRYRHAELLWQRAERERSPAVARQLWQAAAAAFDAVAADAAASVDRRAAAAEAARLARDNLAAIP